MVTVTHLRRPHQNIAYEHFHSTGALAMLPLKNLRMATIWTDKEKNIAALMQLPEAEFRARLQRQIGYRTGQLLQTEKRFCYPLKYLHVKPADQIRDHVILIGNAAHTLHPVAAQGLNLALQEVEFLANHFSQQEKSLQNTSDRTAPVMPDAIPVSAFQSGFSHQLTRFFTADFFPVPLARQVGMVLLDTCLPAKREFVRKILERNMVC